MEPLLTDDDSDENDHDDYDDEDDDQDDDNDDDNEDDDDKGCMDGLSALQWLSMVACQTNPCPFSYSM